jgi:ABC-type sugar transport system substrate-binding protein
LFRLPFAPLREIFIRVHSCPFAVPSSRAFVLTLCKLFRYEELSFLRFSVLDKRPPMKKLTSFPVPLSLLILTMVLWFPATNHAAAKELTFGYITPGPDTWYKRDVDGFVLGAKMLGIKTVVLNSDYDVQKEVSNIDSLITQGVNGMAIFSFNQQGAITAANKCKAAGIPLVTVDNCGQALASGSDIVAAVDFDWKAMGKNYADYIAEHFPGKKVVPWEYDPVWIQLTKQYFPDLGAHLPEKAP